MAKKFVPNTGQKKILSALAYCLLAQNFDHDIEGMEGVFDAFINADENQETKEIWQSFNTEVKKVRVEFMRLAEQDKDFWGTDGNA